MLPVSIVVDPDDPRPKDIAGYFAAVARRLDELPERMRLSIEAPRGTELDMDREGRLVFRVPGHRPAPLDIRRRWIAEHPVPLDLGGRTVLIVVPVDANRFRVSLPIFPRIRRFFRRLCGKIPAIAIGGNL